MKRNKDDKAVTAEQMERVLSFTDFEYNYNEHETLEDYCINKTKLQDYNDGSESRY